MIFEYCENYNFEYFSCGLTKHTTTTTTWFNIEKNKSQKNKNLFSSLLKFPYIFFYNVCQITSFFFCLLFFGHKIKPLLFVDNYYQHGLFCLNNQHHPSPPLDGWRWWCLLKRLTNFSSPSKVKVTQFINLSYLFLLIIKRTGDLLMLTY